MYSDSIKKKQQELLDVLFKKASGRSEATFIKSAWPEALNDINPHGKLADYYTAKTIEVTLPGDIMPRKVTQAEYDEMVAAGRIRNEEAHKLDEQRKRNELTRQGVKEWVANNPNKPVTKQVEAEVKQKVDQVMGPEVQTPKPTPAPLPILDLSAKPAQAPLLQRVPAPTTAPAEPSVPTPDWTPLPVDADEVEVGDYGDDDTDSPLTGAPDISPLGQAPTPTPAKASKPNWSDIKHVGSQLRKMTGLDAIKGMYDDARNGMSSIMTGVNQSRTAPANQETPGAPTSSTPEGEGTAAPETPTTPEGGGSKPSTPKPVAVRETEQAAEPGQKTTTPGGGGGTTDWNSVIDGLLDRVKRHKLMSIGGLGGAGLGALFGGESFTDRLLWALLGGGAGTGLGYLAEKYLK